VSGRGIVERKRKCILKIEEKINDIHWRLWPSYQAESSIESIELPGTPNCDVVKIINSLMNL